MRVCGCELSRVQHQLLALAAVAAGRRPLTTGRHAVPTHNRPALGFRDRTTDALRGSARGLRQSQIEPVARRRTPAAQGPCRLRPVAQRARRARNYKSPRACCANEQRTDSRRQISLSSGSAGSGRANCITGSDTRALPLDLRWPSCFVPSRFSTSVSLSNLGCLWSCGRVVAGRHTTQGPAQGVQLYQHIKLARPTN